MFDWWQYTIGWAFWNRWTLGLDFGLGNAGLWTDILVQKVGWCVFWADISGNIGPESSISGSKVQAQGPAIPQCPSDELGYMN